MNQRACASGDRTFWSPQVCCAILKGRLPEFNNNRYINILILVLCMCFKYILEDIYLYRFFLNEENITSKQIHIHYFTEFFLNSGSVDFKH